MILLAGCAQADRKALDAVSDLGPFKDHSFYEVMEVETRAGERGVYGFAKMVVVVKKGLTKEEREKVAWAYNKAFPKTRVDFFDDESGLENYIKLDKKHPDGPREHNLVYDRGFIEKHRVAQLMQTEKGDWFVTTEPYKAR